MNEMVYVGSPATDMECMKDDLITYLKKILDEVKDNPEYFKIAGEITDMIKDFAETARNCEEAEYYRTVTEAMRDYGDDMYDDYDNRAGYDAYRYANGRYAPTGHGHRGYSRTGQGNRSQSGSMNGYWDGNRPMMDGHQSQHGTSFEGYRRARRNYTQTHSPNDKQEMDAYANEHIMTSISSIREVLDSADPELRQRAIQDLSKLINDMNK